MPVAPDLRTDIVLVLGSACLRIEHRALNLYQRLKSRLDVWASIDFGTPREECSNY